MCVGVIRVLVVCNLKAAKLGGIPSHGMVLCASNADHTEVEFLEPPEGAKIGFVVPHTGMCFSCSFVSQVQL